MNSGGPGPHLLYVGFLLRLAHSEHRHRFVLTGGVLPAAYQLRRPTSDSDFAALQTTDDVDSIRRDVIAIAGIVLPAHLDDGLTFDLGNVTAQVIRDQDQYSGVRVRLAAAFADPVLTTTLTAEWDPATRAWSTPAGLS